LGMFFSGYIAERSNLRIYLAIWMSVGGLVLIIAGLAKTFNIHSMWYFAVVQLASGIAQSTGWPAVLAVVGEWFGTAKKGLILGLWNWHTSIGNIVGSAVAGAFVEQDWSMSYFSMGCISISVGVLCFFFLIPSKRERLQPKGTSILTAYVHNRAKVCGSACRL